MPSSSNKSIRYDQQQGLFSLRPMDGRPDPPGANATSRKAREPLLSMADRDNPAVSLTTLQIPEVRSADTHFNDRLIHQSDNLAPGYGQWNSQQEFISTVQPSAGGLSLPGNTMPLPAHDVEGGERQALLSNIDPPDEEDADITSSTDASLLPSARPSTRSPVTSSALFKEVGESDDVEAALKARRRNAPDQFLKCYETSKWEIWAYYAYGVGNNGMTLAILAPMAMQNLLNLAASKDGLLSFLGRDRTVNSVALLANSISFSIQIAVFLVLGSFADFGNWRSGILIIQSLIGIAIGFAWLGLHNAEKWKIGVVTYTIGLVAFQTSAAYFTAAFPALARNTPKLRIKAEELNAGIIEREDYDNADSAVRNHISNMSLWVSGAFGIIELIAMMIILSSVDPTASTANNNWGLSLIIAFSSAVWLLCAIPWFVLEKRRPGPPVPPGTNIWTAGVWQVYRAATQIWKLKQSLAYLIGYFILGEALNTSVAVIGTLQMAVAEYNITQLIQFIMMQFASATIGVWVCIKIQEKFAVTTKTMLCSVAVCIVIMNLWGVVGIWTESIGYHHLWEFWVYGFWYGCFVSPWYSYSQTMISEVTPRGKDCLFFSLFNIIGKASSFLGPLLSSAIIDAVPSHNPHTPFYLLAALSIVSLGIVIFFVDLNKSRIEQDRYLEDERLERLAMTEYLRQKVL